jgi:hypothetical protein
MSLARQSQLHITFWLYATFFVRDKGIAKQFQRTKNVAEKKRTKGASPTAFFRSPSRRKAAKRIQTCYVPYARILLFRSIYFL